MRRLFPFVLLLLSIAAFEFQDTLVKTSATGPQRPALINGADSGPLSPTYSTGKTAVVNYGADTVPDYALCVQANTLEASVAILGYHAPTGEYRRLWQSEVNECATVAAIDAVGDGRRELFVLGHDGFVNAYNSADGRLLRRVRVTGEYAASPNDMAAGDVDGDGRPEIIVVHGYGTYVLSANFLSVKWIAEDRGGDAAYVGNFDADSDVEVLVRRGFYDSYLLDVANQKVDGEIATELGPIRGVGDVDGDPQTEILHVPELRATVFDPTTNVERWDVHAPFGAGFVDVDGNGRLEVAVGKWGPPSALDVFAGDTGALMGTVATPGYVPVAGYNAADLDSDGARELIWIGEPSEPRWRIFIGDLAAAEVEAQIGSEGEDPLLTLADLDGDGAKERIVANVDNGTVTDERIAIFDGATGRPEPGLALPGWYAGEIAAIGVGQVDGDPAREIVVGRGYITTSQIVIFDAVTRQAQWTGEGGEWTEIYRLIVANMDADATDEIIVGYLNSIVEIRDGPTGAVEWSLDPPEYELYDMKVGDADGDGARDLVVVTPGKWVLYRGPAFDLVHQGVNYGNAIAIGNRDMQGPGEIIVPGYDSAGNYEIWVYHGQTLELIAVRPMTFLPEPYIDLIAVGDFDADGVQEYVVAGTVDDPEEEQTNFLMIDNYENPLPWPEYTKVDRLGWPKMLVPVNADDDPQIELAFSAPNSARLFDIRVEDIVTYASQVPVTLKNWPRPVEKRFVDQFSNPASGWPVISNDVAKLFYADGRYHIEVHVPERMVSVLSPAPFTVTDYTLDVDARSTHNARAYGVLYDWTDWDNYNAVLIAPGDDQVGVFHVRNGELLYEYPWNHFSYLESGMNHIRVEREAWLIRIFINGEPLLGHIVESNGENVRTGLVMLSTGNGSETAAFDNFDLREKWWDGEPPNPTALSDEWGDRADALWRALPMK